MNVDVDKQILDQPVVNTLVDNPKNNNVFATLLAILALTSIAISLFLYYQNQQLKKEVQDISLQISSLSKDQSSNIISTPSTSAFKKKHFLSSDKFLDTYDYPNELLNLKDEDLVGFNCSNKYNNRFNGNFSFYNNDSEQNQQEFLTDENIINILKTIDEEVTNDGRSSIMSAMTCTTDTDKTLLSYEVTPGGGGAGSSAYYGYVSNGNILKKATIPMENGAYFGCSDILAITKTGSLYVNCGAGDGGAGTKSLYKVNINNGGNATLVYKCESSLTNPEQGLPLISCGTIQ